MCAQKAVSLKRSSSETLCCVCFGSEKDDVFVKMPCCFATQSSTSYCRGCLKKICEISTVSGIGRCPTCRSKFMFDLATDNVTNDVPKIKGRCGMCCQVIDIEERGLCSACLLGETHAFRYQCDGCHRIQSIPHPMWRYQNKPDVSGGATWACHQGCNDYTHWKILAEDADRIPDNECPESWGRREAWLEQIARLVRQDRARRVN